MRSRPYGEDLTGQKFFTLIVLKRAERKIYKRASWICQCECGQIIESTTQSLVFKKITRCKVCANKTRSSLGKNKTHGKTKTGTYSSWRSMLKRCDYRNTHGKMNNCYDKITVCKEWYSFEFFLSDMGDRPEKMTLGRIDNLKGYSKENCRWADSFTQNNNRSFNRIVEVNCEKLTLVNACKKYNLNYSRVYKRIENGWPIEKALFTPKRVYPKEAKSGMGSEIKG